MEEKSLSGVGPVYNQVRDTATGWAIHRIDSATAMNIQHLVFFTGLTLRATISCGVILGKTNA
jgi:hypothetical protein